MFRLQMVVLPSLTAIVLVKIIFIASWKRNFSKSFAKKESVVLYDGGLKCCMSLNAYFKTKELK